MLGPFSWPPKRQAQGPCRASLSACTRESGGPSSRRPPGPRVLQLWSLAPPPLDVRRERLSNGPTCELGLSLRTAFLSPLLPVTLAAGRLLRWFSKALWPLLVHSLGAAVPPWPQGLLEGLWVVEATPSPLGPQRRAGTRC